MTKIDKQAVIVIHGMGEQIPMDTLKSFVNAVWVDDKVTTANGLPFPDQVWSKPDERTGSLELRRITTRESIKSPPEFPNGVRTDFYELYWADLTAGAGVIEFWQWIHNLLLRMPKRVPKGLLPAWLLLWLATLITSVLTLLPFLPGRALGWMSLEYIEEARPLFVVLAVGMIYGLNLVATTTFGRVVRYTRAEPKNIAAREAIRQRGLKLMEELHSGGYKRVAIVAHSLGTILALDLLSYFWSRRAPNIKIEEGSPEFLALCAVERAAAAIIRDHPDPEAIENYHQAQREFRELLAAPQSSACERWIITDLVTLGSPLTHAEILLANSSKDLDDRKAAREIIESPPFRESIDPSVLARAVKSGTLPIAAQPEKTRLMCFPAGPSHWLLHHAAPFAAVRWTNIYDQHRWIFRGDIISGPIAPVLGPAIVDINLADFQGGLSWTFTHQKYWKVEEEGLRTRLLQYAVNILDKRRYGGPTL